jgi:hypothetical protein
MLGRNYSARNMLEKICPTLSGWSANEKLGTDFRFAPQPGRNAAKPENDGYI